MVCVVKLADDDVVDASDSPLVSVAGLLGIPRANVHNVKAVKPTRSVRDSMATVLPRFTLYPAGGHVTGPQRRKRGE